MASHMARRTCVTILLKLTAHSDIKTLIKYENTSDEALVKELERVGELSEVPMKIA